MQDTRDKEQSTGRVAVDAKKRVSIARALDAVKAVVGDDMDKLTFHVFTNALGYVILKPEISIPAHEIWLYRNPEALESVQRGIKQAEEGKLVELGSFEQYADDELA